MAPWHGVKMAPAAAPASPQPYFRSDSSDSAARMLDHQAPPPRQKQKRCSPVWLAVAAMGLLALQIASATGLFVYFSMSIAKLKAQAQGTSEELRCLLLLNSLQELSELEDLIGNRSCLKLARSIQAYIDMLATENVIQKKAQSEALSQQASPSGGQLVSSQASGKPSAHLTLRRQRPAQAGVTLGAFGELQQSCQHPIPSWANRTLHSHLQDIAYQGGMLQISRPGKYYIYAQIYFRYPTEGTNSRALGHQLVQCINLQSAHGENILLLKGVGTKCWTQDAAYGLHALYQGGLFDLKAGNKLFVSVSSLDINYEEAGSYFGAFRLDV